MSCNLIERESERREMSQHRECMHDKLLSGFRQALPELIGTLDDSIVTAQEIIASSPAKIDGDIDDFRKIVSGIITEVVDTIGPEPKAA